MLLPLPQLLKGCAMPLSAIEFCKIASWSCYEQRFQHNMIWNLIHAIIKWNTSDRLYCSKISIGNGEVNLLNFKSILWSDFRLTIVNIVR